MSKCAASPSHAHAALVLFTPAERQLIRHEMYPRFGQEPRLADGIMLRIWRGGPNAGQPKISPAVGSLLDRGLVEICNEGRWPTARFTNTGLSALREMARDRRALDPARYGHVRRELGLETDADVAPAGDSGTEP